MRDGLRRFLEFSVRPVVALRGARRALWKWRRRDRRLKVLGYAASKWAVNRDGDFGLVECPVCHDQSVWFVKEECVFVCGGGRSDGHRFLVYLEDGVVQLRDHRCGDIRYFPAIAVNDGKDWHLGLTRDAPWWWRRREVYRDLRADGKDGHGHKPYVVLPSPSQLEASGREEAAP